MSGPVEAVLIDFGGVFTHSPFNMVSQCAENLGADPQLVGGLVFGDYYRDTDHPWHRLERGEISLETARQAIAALGRAEGLELDLFELFSLFPRDGGLRHEVVDCVRQLRRDGRRTAVVTNNIAEFGDGWRSILPAPVEELFDAVVDSSAEGVRKPNPAIYRLALERLGGVAPSRAVFVDDFDGNVRAARELGMRTVLMGEDTAAGLAELRRCLDA